MGRGVSSGGGQSSLGYLFGSGEATNTAPPPAENAARAQKPTALPVDNSKQIPAGTQGNAGNNYFRGDGQNSDNLITKPAALPVDNSKQIPAGIQGNAGNNYFRADGQNSGNFITERPSTKVHAAPGGGSSLGYLFGNGGN